MRTNEQQPEAPAGGDGTVIAVNSIFHTIQGEGPFAGTPAIFVRLAGCNLQCPMCDTEYSRRAEMSIHAILCAVSEWRDRCRLVVITGGEPFRQNIELLVKQLIDVGGYRVQIETNGTLWQEGFTAWRDGLTIVCSPKTGSVNKKLMPFVHAWKYVATADNIHLGDGLPTHALGHPCRDLFRPPKGHTAPVYLQPVDERNTAQNRRNQDAVVQSCLTHGHRLCLQLHKIIGQD